MNLILAGTNPISEAFKSGKLEMPTAPSLLRTPEAAWGDYPLNAALIITCTVLFLLNLSNLRATLGRVCHSVTHYRECFHIEESIPLAKARNLSYLMCLPALTMVVDRWELLDYDFMSLHSPDWRICVTACCLVLFYFLRFLAYYAIRPQGRDMANYRCTRMSGRNFTILLTLFLILLCGFISLFKVEETLARKMVIWSIVGIYAVFLVHKSQIFASYCRGFSTFLYLCALEILPTAILAGTIAWL